MSPEVATPTLEQTLAVLATRVRQLEAQEIKLPVLDARAFGARGDGSDDTDAIQACANAASAIVNGGTVFLADPPGGHYLLPRKHGGAYPAALRWPPNVDLLGTGHACELRANGNYGIITREAAVELHTQSFRNFRLFYEGTHTNPGWTRANAIWLDGAPDCNHLLFENIWMQDAYTGFLDDSNAWGNTFINVIATGCRNGFRKTGTGTGNLYISCYAKGTAGAHYAGVHWDMKGWSFEQKGVGGSWIACAMDDYWGDPTNGTEIGLWRDQMGFLIAGFDFERCRVSNPGGLATMFRFEKDAHDNYGVIHGFVANLCYLGELAAEAGDGVLMSIYRGHVALDANVLGPNVTSRKLGNVDTLLVDEAEVSARASAIKDIAGAGVARGIVMGGVGSELTIDRVDYDGPITNPNNRKVLVLDEISVGTANSGGAGFRLLRVPNAPDTRDGPLP